MKNFHNKIKPHHHVSLWAMALLLFVWSSVNYTNSQYSFVVAQDGPSQNTQDFFGDSGPQHEDSQPAECQRNQQNDQQAQIKVQEHERIMNRIREMEVQLNSTPEDQRGQISAEMEQLRNQETQLQNELTQLDQRGQEQRGPSEECKKAIVAKEKSGISEIHTKMKNKFLPALDKVDTVTAKIKSFVPKLKAEGLEDSKIKIIETDIASIEENSKALKSFFQEMISTFESFLAVSEEDPSVAFEKLQTSFGQNGPKTQGFTYADNLVDSFEDLEKVINEIKENKNGAQ